MSASTRTIAVRFLPSGTTTRVPSGTSLLEAARQVGLPVASACGADGLCGRCGMQILEGAADVAQESEGEQSVRRANRVADGLRLSCRILLNADLVVTAPYW